MSADHEITLHLPTGPRRMRASCSCGWRTENRGGPPTTMRTRMQADARVLRHLAEHVAVVRVRQFTNWEKVRSDAREKARATMRRAVQPDPVPAPRHHPAQEPLRLVVGDG